MDPAEGRGDTGMGGSKSVKGIWIPWVRYFIDGLSGLLQTGSATTRPDQEECTVPVTDEADAAFESLKGAFITAPILAQFDQTSRQY